MDSCRVCGAAGEHPRFRAREMMLGRRDEFEYFTCTACGCLQIAEVPANLGEYYPADYYSFGGAGDGRVAAWLKRRRAVHLLTGRSAVGRLATRWFGRPELFDWIEQSGVGFGDAILDVGSGAGSLLLQLRDIGFRNLLGVDPFIERDLEYPGGVRVLRRGIAEVEGRFDLVMLHHSFEHMPDPGEAMRHIFRLLTPGGVALVRIPVADSWGWRHYGTDWVQLDPPRHLFLHTKQSLEILASAAGLRVERVVHDSTAFQFWGSEQYRRGIPLQDARSYGRDPRASGFTAREIRAFEARAAELNASGEGDQAAFYLRRAG